VPLAAIWHGSNEQRQRFQHVIERNCTCEIDEHGTISGRCPAHLAILDQRFLDGLLWAHYLREQLLAEELG
jgi:hypothetical protein